jgi:MFS family permease
VRLTALPHRCLPSRHWYLIPDSDTRRATAIQGLGAGAITSSVQTVMSDLVTLRERGTFSGFLALFVPVLCLVKRLLMDRVQILGSRRRCWSSNWRIISSKRALVRNFSPGFPASCFLLKFQPLLPTGDGYSVRTTCAFFLFSACHEPRTDLNLPICVFNATLVLLFMRLRTPPATLGEKLSKIDFM